ncbi:MAG: SPASM domain-containing protein [Syntrophotaleaceae bacterium]
MNDLPLPTYLQVEPSGRCNLLCRMCPIRFRTDLPKNGSPALMDFRLFAELLDGFPGLEKLHLQGLGEPLLHPRFFDMAAFARKRGLVVTTSTNLTLLDETQARECVISGLNELHISVDGTSAETYEWIRTGADYRTLKSNLELLVKTRRRMSSSTPVLKLVMVIMRKNLAELPDLVDLAKEWDMEEVFVQHLSQEFSEPDLSEKVLTMRNFVEEQTLLHENPQRIARYFGAARSKARKAGIRLRLPKTEASKQAPDRSGRERCDWPWSGIYVSWTGQVMPCCMAASPDRVSFGSLAEKPVRDIWNGPEYLSFREQLQSRRPPRICRECSIYRGIF